MFAKLMLAIKRFLIVFVAPETQAAYAILQEEIFALRADNKTLTKQVSDLKAENTALDDDKKKLFDYIIYAAGGPMLYTNEPTKAQPAPLDPLRNISQARDWSMKATALENEAGMSQFINSKRSQ